MNPLASFEAARSRDTDRYLRDDHVTVNWVEHVGEVELAIDAPSASDVLAEAAGAIASLLVDRLQRTPTTCEIEVSANDRPALLVAWLDELVYLAETDGFAPERIVKIGCSERSARATVEGRSGRPTHLVKAVTYHDLAFKRCGERWQGRVVLDV